MNTVIKRLVCGFLAFLVLLVSVIIPDFSSFAESGTTVVIPADDSTHYYVLNHYETYYDASAVWTEQTFLTVDNYVLNYDKLSGQEKTAINNKFVDTLNDTGVQGIINDFLYPSYTVPSGFLNITNLYFLPVIYNNQTIPFEDCTHLIAYIRTGSAEYWAMYQFYCPTGKEIIMSGNTAYCEDVFYFTYQPFQFASSVIDNIYHNYYAIGSPERLTSGLDSTHNIYYTTLNPNAYDGTVLCDMQYLFTSSNLSGISTDYDSYNSYLNNVSYAIDRRPDKFKNAIDPNGGGSGMNDIVSLDYDPNLFNGVLGFNWFNPSCSLNYNQHTSSYFPYYIVKYEINNYTDIHKTECSLIIDADIALKLNVNDPNNDYDGSGAYSTISHYHYNNELLLNDNLDGFTLFATTNSNSWTNTSLRTARGFNTATHLTPFNGDLTFDINNIISQWETSGSIDKTNSYGVFRLMFYVRNNITGAVSETFTAEFNLLTNQYTDNRNDIISNDNQEFIDFKNSFDYQNNNGDYLPVDYANYVNGGGSSSSVGNITINQNPYPYVLVDIPENEWMNYTPNLKTLLTDFKTMLAETKDDSVLKMLPETYSYFPAPFMQYMLYGIGIIIMIGIWRAITRR